MAIETAAPSASLSDRLHQVIRRIAVQGVAGVVAGIVVGGIGGRIAMRLSALAAGEDMVGRITENGNRIGTISLEGTIELILFGGALSGALAAILLVALRPWLRWAGRWQGAAAGIALLGIAGATLIEAGNRDFVILDPAWLNVAMFSAIVVGYGWLAVSIADWWLRRDTKPAAPVFHVAPIVIGAPLVIPLLGAFFLSDFCNCADPPVLLGIVVVLAMLSTGAAFVGEIAGRSDLVRWIRPAGFTLVALAFVLGLIRLAEEIATIV